MRFGEAQTVADCAVPAQRCGEGGALDPTRPKVRCFRVAACYRWTVLCTGALWLALLLLTIQLGLPWVTRLQAAAFVLLMGGSAWHHSAQTLELEGEVLRARGFVRPLELLLSDVIAVDVASLLFHRSYVVRTRHTTIRFTSMHDRAGELCAAIALKAGVEVRERP